MDTFYSREYSDLTTTCFYPICFCNPFFMRIEIVFVAEIIEFLFFFELMVRKFKEVPVQKIFWTF